MGRVMLDVICETSMGVTANALESAESKYVQAVDRIKNLTMHRFFPSIWNNKLVYPFTAEGKEYKEMLGVSHNFVRDVIAENLASRRSKTDEQIVCTAQDNAEDETGSSYT